MSREPAATHRIGHISDSHFTASGLLHGRVRTGDTFAAALDALARSGVPVDAVVHTGDVADEGEADAYRAARAVLDAAALGVLPVPGNHDDRAAMREHLLGLPPSADPIDAVHDVRGLRLVLLDTSIPGRVEGGLDDEQLDRLRAVLAEPAEHGTVIALHHPPVPVEVTGLQRLHLTGQDRLAAALAGTDVRAILGGHLHYATTSVFAGVPVFVAPATAYTIALRAPGGGVAGLDGGRAVGVLTCYDDGRVGWSLLPADGTEVIAETPDAVFDGMGVDVEA
ncbi:MAG TPA: metallophosphoesterase [Amnibacterium sp.]|jgi:3',5'-cyclic AMP phosphodiesterase CpdA|uniref:metallophosphoesterase n=1 Tax=Amnibacterium sp. TaxID=1872496 RepID=UPI002F950C1D